MFGAIQRVDHACLRTLAKTFIEAGNDPAALLCLDHIFSSPHELRHLPLSEIHALLSLHFDYIRLLNRLRRDDSFAEGSKHQRLFGFQVLGEDSYLVPKHTVVHVILNEQTGMSADSEDGYKCTYAELSRTIVRLISNRIYSRTELQDNACRDAHGFSPCLTLLIQGQCDRGGSCEFQHVQQDHLTVEWCHTRVLLILLHFRILNSAHYYPPIVAKYVLGYSEG